MNQNGSGTVITVCMYAVLSNVSSNAIQSLLLFFLIAWNQSQRLSAADEKYCIRKMEYAN